MASYAIPKRDHVPERFNFSGNDHLYGVQAPETSTKAMPMRRLLTTKEAATYLGISTWTIRQWHRKSLVKAIRGQAQTWLWDVEDLNECVRRLKA